ncbi:MAG: RimK family alpha-L-glutamate ligase [Alphaproteobacteria bacterium]|nr:MAG: RimK family alpha-L-glutamate ligase [Alphaproteobacteria bacterium]
MRMRIGILTTGNDEEEDNRLVNSAKAQGHDAKLLHVTKCSLTVCSNTPEIYYEGSPISQIFDVIIPRIDTAHTEYGLAVLRQFQSMHIFTSDNAYALKLGRDKLRCTQRLLKEEVPFPTTGFAYSNEDFDNIIKTVGGVPLVIKLIEGTEGVGVFLADDMKHAVNLLKTFKKLSTPLIVQKFIEESAGTDIRAFVVGGEIIACMERKSSDGDFRANIALGGHSKAITLSEEEKNIALKATQAIGINIAGVDLIRSHSGTLVIEINTSPDFGGQWGLESISKVDVAGAIIKFAVNEARNSFRGNRILKQAS